MEKENKRAKEYFDRIKSYNYQDKEEWRDVPGYEGLYMASSHGHIVTSHLNGVRNGNNYLIPGTSGKGYGNVTLTKDGVRAPIKAHQVITMTFHGHVPCGMKLIVHHKDDDKLNNHKDNLELVTNRQNCSFKLDGQSSIYLGVSYNKKTEGYKDRYDEATGELLPKRIWIAEMRQHKMVDGEMVPWTNKLGTFVDEKEAGQAYQDELARYEGTERVIL